MTPTVLRLGVIARDGHLGVRASTETHQAEGASRLDGGMEYLLRDAAERVATKRMDWPSQLEFGQQLGRLLLPGGVRSLLVDAVGALAEDQRLQIRIDLDGDLAAALPWELIHVPELGRETALGPYLVLDDRVALARTVVEPLRGVERLHGRRLRRIVIAPASAVDGWVALQADEGVLVASDLGVLTDLECTVLDDPVDKAAVRASLRGLIDVFHFIGHGLRGEGVMVAGPGGSAVEQMPFDELGPWLANAGTTLAVLNACETGVGAHPGTGGAEVLLRCGVPAVVAMQHPIEDSHAVVFARAFYRALANGEPIDLAVHRGRQAMCLLGLSSEWAVPVLYLGGDQRLDLWQPSSRPPASPPSRSTHEPIRFRLPPVVSGFSGRERELAALGARSNLVRDGVRVQFITGLGGIGKTQLAAAYVHQRAAAFDVVAWVRAERGATTDLVDLARRLGLPDEGRTPAEQAAGVWEQLGRSDRSWLVVLDNVDDPALLSEVPTSGRGELLVTSRLRGGRASLGPELVVQGLDLDAATAFLVASTGRLAEADEARRVAESLGCLPLALAQAASYCASDGLLGFADYRELVDQLRSEVLFEDNRADQYELTVAATWTASVELAQRWEPSAARILDMAAFLAPDGMDRGLFVRSDATAEERKAVVDAVHALRRTSLLTVDGDRVRMHRLLQKVIRDRMAPARAAVAFDAAVDAVDRLRPASVDDPDSWPDWMGLLAHVEELANMSHLDRIDGERLVRVLSATVSFLLSVGSPEEAHRLAVRSVRVGVKLFGADAPQTLLARWTLTRAQLLAGAAPAASVELTSLVDEAAAAFGPDSAEVLGIRCDLALVLEAQRRSDEAMEVARPLLTDCERLLGGDAPLTAQATRALCASLRSVGSTAEAIELLEPVLTAQGDLPEASQELFALVSLLASCYRAQGHLDRAIRIGELLVTRCERVLGASHLITLRARFDLSSSYRSAGRVDASIAIEEELVRERSRLLGPRHDDTLWAMNDLVVSYQSAGRTTDAVTLGRQLVALRREVAGREHSATLTAVANLAISLRADGRHDEAIELQQRLVEARERVLGVDHFSTHSARDHLGVSLRRAGRTDEAIEVARAVVDDRTRMLGGGHPASLVALDNLGAALRASGRIDEAVVVGRTTLVGEERRLGSSHPETLWALANLARAVHAAGEREEAAVLLERARVAAHDTLGADHPYLRWITAIAEAWYGHEGADPDGCECERVLWE